MEKPAYGSVRIGLGRGYSALVGAGVLGAGVGAPEAGLGEIKGRRVLVVVDAGVPIEPVGVLLDSLRGAGACAITHEARADERLKSLAEAERILRAMSDARLERGDLLFALGGGIVGDMAGFAAAVYRRGIRWVQCPTTLLAMVDASVGGKTGVNLVERDELRKNAVGVFHQPSLVLADVRLLDSLPERELRCGLAECIKHGMIGGVWGAPELLDWIGGTLPRLLAREHGALAELVLRNIAVKAQVVGADEREEADGVREQLNLGHTFGHALESLGVCAPERMGGGRLRHGEAVGLGLIAAAACARELGLSDEVDRVRAVIERAGLPVAAALPASAKVLDAMMHDKKVRGGRLRLVLPAGSARVVVREDVPGAAVLAGVEAIRAIAL